MTEVVFVIYHTPANKHRLVQRMPKPTVNGQAHELDRGLYDTHALALEAMDRIIKPVTYSYDKDGELIT